MMSTIQELEVSECMLGNFASFFSSAEFLKNHIFQKYFSRIPSKCHTVWIQIRPDVLSDLI